MSKLHEPIATGKQKQSFPLGFNIFSISLQKHISTMEQQKYPIGIQSFEKIRKENFAYVDKTALVYRLANEGNYYFLSRPRRFGKSLLISTFEAYFLGQRELFEGLAIEKLEQKWTVFPVLHLDLNNQKYDTPESLLQILDVNVSYWEDRYGRNEKEATLSLRFAGVIRRAFEQSGQRVVILVDEYDKPLLQAIGNEALQAEYRATLKAFYSVLKTQDRYIRFGFLTGVTKFGKVSVFSDLNNLFDLSMDDRYQTLCGMTEEEIHANFDDTLHRLAEHNRLSYEEACRKLRLRYDGYHFVENGVGIYNPFSLLGTLATLKFGSYWFETGTPSYLVELLKQDRYLLPNLTEEQVSADFLNSIDSVSKNPIPVIYQSGYLTIKGYDDEFETYRLGFPNQEVEEGFTRYLVPFYTHIHQGESVFSIQQFIQDIRNGQPERFMQRMATMLSDTDYQIVGDAELYFQNAFYLISKMLGFYTEVERTTSDGRMDMVIKTRDYIYIMEFKLDGTPQEALRQIEDKGYAKPFGMDGRKICRIGVNFSLKKRCIDGWEIA